MKKCIEVKFMDGDVVNSTARSDNSSAFQPAFDGQNGRIYSMKKGEIYFDGETAQYIPSYGTSSINSQEVKIGESYLLQKGDQIEVSPSEKFVVNMIAEKDHWAEGADPGLVASIMETQRMISGKHARALEATSVQPQIRYGSRVRLREKER